MELYKVYSDMDQKNVYAIFDNFDNFLFKILFVFRIFLIEIIGLTRKSVLLALDIILQSKLKC